MPSINNDDTNLEMNQQCIKTTTTNPPAAVRGLKNRVPFLTSLPERRQLRSGLATWQAVLISFQCWKPEHTSNVFHEKIPKRIQFPEAMSSKMRLLPASLAIAAFLIVEVKPTQWRHFCVCMTLPCSNPAITAEWQNKALTHVHTVSYYQAAIAKASRTCTNWFLVTTLAFQVTFWDSLFRFGCGA